MKTGSNYYTSINTTGSNYYTSINANVLTTDTIPASSITFNNIQKMTIKEQPYLNIKQIKVLNPNKVIGFTILYNNKTIKIKTICDNKDTFSLEYACFLALAKVLYKDTYTYEGIIVKAEELQYQKKYVKIVNKAIREFHKEEKEKEEQKKKEEELKLQKEQKRIKNQEKRKRHLAKQATEMCEVLKEPLISIINEINNK